MGKFTDPAAKKCSATTHPFRKKRGMDGAQRDQNSLDKLNKLNKL
jgi:hypothetical protein